MSYLWDMRKYALEITEIISGIPHARFIENKTVRYAVERLLLIVGEAANHVSKEFQEDHPEIEWAQIIGLRNILAHEYGEVKMDKIYLAATKSIPVLLQRLEQIPSEQHSQKQNHPQRPDWFLRIHPRLAPSSTRTT